MKPVLVFLFLAAINTSLAESSSVSLKIKLIQDGVYLHTSFHEVKGYGLVDTNGLILIDGNQAFIVDTPWSESDTEALVSWINEQGYDLKAGISTHHHEDSAAGIGVLNSKSIPTYASKLTNDLLLAKGRSTATNIFNEKEFLLKAGRLEVFYPGPGHTIDNVVVWLPKESILFGGCFVKGLEWNSLGYVGDASIDRWEGSIRKVKSRYPVNISIVPGHGKIGNIQLLDHTIELVQAASDKSNQPTAKASAD